ncbi:hypothetical protein BZL41_07455 [Pseudomonas sp. PIC25]|uniref:antibiotic biosynthesis monooxygenase family protein n=1 Tax=Pseudomonas sp. PIC25 TaxID=1958773 RepID=UPI000BAC12A3|nr:antibiotic biosynthesis monooxygenase [Pseudomonas sp. PIC25]PAU65125.1 hypothetical protein BZL41_07455 [Pseudomonas sp. PIC25]
MLDAPILEVALFTVKAGHEQRIPELRAGLRKVLEDFPGLLAFYGYLPLERRGVFLDIAEWDSLEHAQAAADAFAAGDPRFQPYMEAIESLTFMGHFRPERVVCQRR